MERRLRSLYVGGAVVKNWADEISAVTESKEFQSCTLRVTWSEGDLGDYNYDTGKYTPTASTVLYEGQARFIPNRAGTWQGGSAQLNATDIRAVRFQIPSKETSTRIPAGAIIEIVSAPFNRGLTGRTAKVTNDFQGGNAATRTIQAFMDADTEDTNG